MSDERMEQNRQPEKTDVVFFSPEMLRLADQHRREQQERLENCRQAAQNGDCAAAVQMGLHYFYGTGGVKKDPDKAFAWRLIRGVAADADGVQAPGLTGQVVVAGTIGR